MEVIWNYQDWAIGGEGPWSGSWPRTQWSLWQSSRIHLCRWENLPEGQPSPQMNTGTLSEWPSGSWSAPWPRPFSLIAQFGWAVSSRKSLGGLKLLPIKNDGSHCVFGDLQCRRHFLYPSPDLYLDTNLSRISTDNLFALMAWFLLWHALSTVSPYIDRYVPFQIMSNQLNLPQVDSNEDVETSQGWSMETGWTWAQFQVS